MLPGEFIVEMQHRVDAFLNHIQVDMFIRAMSAAAFVTERHQRHGQAKFTLKTGDDGDAAPFPQQEGLLPPGPFISGQSGFHHGRSQFQDHGGFPVTRAPQLARHGGGCEPRDVIG